VYEVGHAIYPSASISIGACAKYTCALGIDKTGTEGQAHTFDWVESEERSRAWWAIVILDRFSNLGSSNFSLLMEDPGRDAKLPLDDASWDKGIRKSDHPITLSCPASAEMGRYGLMAHASSLLGRALHHRYHSNNNGRFSDEETAILDRALAALTTVTHEEGSKRGAGVCTPTVLCFSARITLALRKQSNDAIEGFHSEQERDIVRAEIARYMVILARWATSGQKPEDEYSPIPLHAAYHSAVAYLEMYRNKQHEEYLAGIEDIKGMLRMYNGRWKSGGVYLKMLEAQETLYMNSYSYSHPYN